MLTSIDGLSKENMVLRIHDVFGKILITKEVSKEITKLDLTRLNSVLYILNISNRKNQINRIFIKK
ncbi:T9SS type A sorting domain-containing protein [Aquimarina litoralis]|uniref:T9SS type A sorting domain-containing protein n=1 Tax=Aquimarina litoralis TaxID=584605 RepID=UPI003D1D32D2